MGFICQRCLKENMFIFEDDEILECESCGASHANLKWEYWRNYWDD